MEHPHVASRREAHPLCRLHQQRAPRLVGRGEAFEHVAVEFGIGARAALRLAGCLNRARRGDPRGDFGAPLGGRGQREVGGADRLYLHMQVDPVEHRAADLALVVGGAPGRAAAGKRGIAQVAAAARVHRRDQLHARREGDMRIGARDVDLARLQRLAQAVENGPLELGQFVEEQDSQMREGDLAGPHLQPA